MDVGLEHRRFAAVLFADLSGFTELVETVEPEIVYQVVRPLMDDLHRWFNKTLAGLSRKSDTAAAIRYALSRWRAAVRD